MTSADAPRKPITQTSSRRPDEELSIPATAPLTRRIRSPTPWEPLESTTNRNRVQARVARDLVCKSSGSGTGVPVRTTS